MAESLHDETLKNLSRLERIATEAIHVSTSLEDKIKYQTVKRTLGRTRNELIKLYYDIEDAQETAKNAKYCELCAQLTI